MSDKIGFEMEQLDNEVFVIYIFTSEKMYAKYGNEKEILKKWNEIKCIIEKM